MKALSLADIHLGSIDAKNEVLGNDPAETNRFLASYVPPPALSVERFSRKEKYFIVGLKGTGKTALLRYVALTLDLDEMSVSKFVLFKSDVDESLRHDFSGAARVEVVAENSDDYEGDDFEAAWRWFIYKKIAQAAQQDKVPLFQRNANLASFVALVNVESDRVGTGSRLIPQIKKGNIEISKDPKLNLELVWDQDGKAKIKFIQLVHKADALFQNLEADTHRLNLFFDELELNYTTSKHYQRDSRLVRDLIITIEKINATAKQRGFPLCLYAAVRSEVVNSVEALGKEINKPLTDFGSKILWNRPGMDAAQQPLLGIIEQRINNARIEHDLPVLTSAELWSTYFPESIHDQKPQVYILHNSWYRPRDVVRLLITAQEQYPDDTIFNVQALEAVRKEYSSASWVELTEELKVKYKAREIDGIKYLFYGKQGIWTISDLRNHAESSSNEHSELKELLERHRFNDVMKDLFRVGVIGNIEPFTGRDERRMRFSSRGDDEILLDHDVFVHNALRAHLSITGAARKRNFARS